VSKKKAHQSFPYTTLSDWLITEEASVYCAVRPASLKWIKFCP